MHSTAGEGALVASLDHPRRVLCSLQQAEHIIMTGLEDGSVRVWDTRTSTAVHAWERMHATRLRGLAAITHGRRGCGSVHACVCVWEGGQESVCVCACTKSDIRTVKNKN